jgi:hypothetical protein
MVDARRALQLPSRLLDGVERTVRELLGNFHGGRGLLPVGLDDVRNRIDELQRVTADFYAALAQMVQSDVTDDALFGDYRDRVVEALRQFPREYGRALRRVEQVLAELAGAGHRQVVEAAVMHAGLIDPRDQQQWVDERVRRLADLAAWFAPAGSVQRLIGSATGAVHTLLVAIDRRYTALRRGSDLGADSRELAYSLHAQPNDVDARRVYAAAFGSWPARHAVVGSVEEDVAYATMAAGGRARQHVEVVLRERDGEEYARNRRTPAGGTGRDQAVRAPRAVSSARCRSLSTRSTRTLPAIERGLFARSAPAAIRSATIYLRWAARPRPAQSRRRRAVRWCRSRQARVAARQSERECCGGCGRQQPAP